MDTVLGLSMTPTTVGWVLADGHDSDGATLARDEFAVQPRSGGVDAVNASEQAAAAVLRVQTMVETQGERLRGVGVTWSADAVAEAALLVESLTDAGFDNVLPVRFDQAAESLTGGSAEPAEPSAPAAAEPEAQLALARGAALALEPGAELRDVFTDVSSFSTDPGQHRNDARTSEPGTERAWWQKLSYTGALTLLAAGAVTFVVSLSIALTPSKEAPPVHQVAKAPGPAPIAQTVVPVVAPPPAHTPEVPAEAAAEAPVAFESTGEAPVLEGGAEGGAAPLEEPPTPPE